MYKPELNLAIFGHADHGKSTIAGKLLSVINKIIPLSLEELREKAIILDNKKYNPYNYLFLKSRTSTTSPETNLPDDQSRTVFPQVGYLDIDEERSFAIIDTPGSSRFLDNIIYGAFLADKAILVVESTSGFEEGIYNIIRILDAFNVPIVGVLISKMDKTNYSKAIYDEVAFQLQEKILPTLGAIPIIPVSALDNEGIVEHSKCIWYQGMNVISLLNTLSVDNAKEIISKDIYFTIEGAAEVFSPKGVGTVFNGILESGCISVNNQLVLEPISSLTNSNIGFNVKSVQYVKGVNQTKRKERLHEVCARSIVSVSFGDLDYKDAIYYVRRGAVLGTLNHKPTVANYLVCEILFFDQHKVYVGKEYIIFANSCYSTCVVEKVDFKEVINNVDQKNNKDNIDIVKPVKIKSNIVYDIELSLKQPLCIEFESGKSKFNRFVLREHNKIVACGKCITIRE